MPEEMEEEGYPQFIRVWQDVSTSDASRGGNAFLNLGRVDLDSKRDSALETPLTVRTSAKPAPRILKGTIVEGDSPIDVPIGLINLNQKTCYVNALLQCMNAWLYDYAHKDTMHPVAMDLLGLQHREVLELLRYLLLADEHDVFVEETVTLMAARYDMSLAQEHDPSELWAKISSTFDPQESLCSFTEVQTGHCNKCRQPTIWMETHAQFLDDIIFMPAEVVSDDYHVSRAIKQAIGPTKEIVSFHCDKCEAKRVSATIAVSLMMAKPSPKNTIVKAKSSHLKLDLQITLEDRQYDLMGVTMHHGAKLNEGHYMALVRIKNTWYLVNDKDVKIVCADFVYGKVGTKRKGDPTMLFYRIASSMKRGKEGVYDAESPVKGSPQKKHKPLKNKSSVTIQQETKKTSGRDKNTADDKNLAGNKKDKKSDKKK
jgi:hypothetical protein